VFSVLMKRCSKVIYDRKTEKLLTSKQTHRIASLQRKAGHVVNRISIILCVSAGLNFTIESIGGIMLYLAPQGARH